MSVLGQPIPISNFIGTRSIPARSIPDAIQTLNLSLDGTNMTDPALQVALTVDFSPDGGATWASTSPGPAVNPFPVVVTFQGGATDKHGVPLSTYFWESPPIPQGSARELQATLVVSGAHLTTTATITAN